MPPLTPEQSDALAALLDIIARARAEHAKREEATCATEKTRQPVRNAA